MFLMTYICVFTDCLMILLMQFRLGSIFIVRQHSQIAAVCTHLLEFKLKKDDNIGLERA